MQKPASIHSQLIIILIKNQMKHLIPTQRLLLISLFLFIADSLFGQDFSGFTTQVNNASDVVTTIFNILCGIAFLIGFMYNSDKIYKREWQDLFNSMLLFAAGIGVAQVVYRAILSYTM